MSRKPTTKAARPPEGAAERAKADSRKTEEIEAILKGIGGSEVRHFNRQIANAVLSVAWRPKNLPLDTDNNTVSMIITGLRAFKPADEIEGMIAAQAIAMHLSVMECARRAMIPEQPAELAQGFRKSAANMSRTFTELLSALDRKRGKSGQQKVTVEHVHVHAGGKAIVGAVGPGVPAGGGGGNAGRSAGEPHASPARLAHDTPVGPVLPPLWSADAQREPVPVAGDAEWPLPDARRR